MNIKILTRVLFAFGALIALPLALSACSSFDGDDDEIAVSSFPPMNEPELIPVIQNQMIEIWRPGYWAPGKQDNFV